jgi:hypothetical protein
MSRFTAIPNIPQSGLNDWQFSTLTAMKENIDLLTGARGERDSASRAVTKSSITVDYPQTQRMQRITADGTGFVINGVKVPALSDYERALIDIQTLANDVAALRNTVNILIKQLKQ